MCLHHEGSMTGVQYQLMIVRDTLEHLRVHFKFFCSEWFYGKIDVQVKFCTFFHFGAYLKEL